MPNFLSGTRLAGLWQQLRTSFWFLPTAMAVLAGGLSFALVSVDAALADDFIQDLGWIYSFGPDGARAVLSAVAGSMITVAGLTFSITMLTLQLASSQFGPRLLRNFMRDRGNQVVLGTFIATFVYCLLVLRTVRGTEGSSFVPHLSVAAGVGLALASIAVLIYFIHHVASSIRLETLLPDLAAEAAAAVDRLYPEETDEGAARVDAGLLLDAGTAIPAGGSGYVQRIDREALLACARAEDLVVRVRCGPGAFVTDGSPLAVAGPDGRVTEEVAARLREAFLVGRERTPDQDVEFSIRRIVEIAQRALSPGVNDPTTALYCIDRLGETLGRLAGRPVPSPLVVDAEGRVRVVQEAAAVVPMVCSAFAAVARYGMGDADVVDRLLETLDRVAAAARPEVAGPVLALSEAIGRRRPDVLG